MKALPVIALDQPPEALAAALGASFADHGFAVLDRHGLPEDLVSRAWDAARAFFAQDEAAKRVYYRPDLAGARGYTPMRTEIAKGASAADLKEFWHIGRDLPLGSPLNDHMPANLWPAEPRAFRAIFSELFEAFDAVGLRLLSAVALHLGLPADRFTPAVAEGNSVLRLLHYPPVTGDAARDGAIRAGAHEDINLITLLLGAEESGLEILDKEGQWMAVEPPPGGLIVNVGDMLQRLTNNRLRSTTHRVRNPVGERSHHSRHAMPFFVHLRSDFEIRTLPGCIDAAHPDLYPDPILADDYLRERLIEIGLLKT